jgi:hypothetical protein
MMEKFVVSIAFGVLLASNAFGESPKVTFSKNLNVGECSASYEVADKSFKHHVFKKVAAAGLDQKLPEGSAAVECSEKLKAEFKLEAKSCNVFCNPN